MFDQTVIPMRMKAGSTKRSSEDSTSRDVLLLKGLLMNQLDLPQKAIATFAKAYQRQPENAFVLPGIYAEQGNSDPFIDV